MPSTTGTIPFLQSNWKRLLIGEFNKAYILPAIFNMLCVSIVAICSTVIATLIFTTESQQFHLPIALIVVSAISFIIVIASLLVHSVTGMIVFIVANAFSLGYCLMQLYYGSSNALGILVSFFVVAQVKSVDLFGLFWLEVRATSNAREDNQPELEGLEDDHEALVDEE